MWNIAHVNLTVQGQDPQPHRNTRRGYAWHSSPSYALARQPAMSAKTPSLCAWNASGTGAVINETLLNSDMESHMVIRKQQHGDRLGN